MRRFVLLVTCFLLFTGFCRAQYTVKVTVMDTLNSLPVIYSSVVAFRSSDSVIETFGRTNAAGQLTLTVAKEGKYILRVSAPNFADYTDTFRVKGGISDLGIIPMVSKERVLKEFVITRQIAAIKIKGDTTEYVADSFKTKENATVEDLLKKLPGIQVDKNGKITAQGEEVKKILVDGEEFFSDDPKVVTQGLQAGALDKVQVFDKKSDQAEFTGIDDGQKTKTINLELKDNKKKGYFGKLDLGGGTDGYFQNQGMFNAFKGKRQFTAFGIMSNTDKAGLGWRDNEKFGGGNNNTEITEDGGMITYYNGSDDDISGWGGKYEGEGLPKTWTGGLHYADKWNQDKQHISGNYRYALQNLEISGQTITNNPLYVQTAKKNQFSKGERNAVSGLYEWKIDSSTTLKVSVDAGTKMLNTSSVFNTVTNNPEGAVQNTNDRTVKSITNSQFFNANASLRKKFAKKGRTLSVDVKENYKESVANGNIASLLRYVVVDSVGNKTDSLNGINQDKKNNSGAFVLEGRMVYTEPLSKVSFIEASYGVVLNRSTSKNYSYNIINGRPSDNPDLNYSSDYKYNILINRGGINYKYVNKTKKKLTFSIGTDFTDATYEQTELLHTDKSLNANYFNIYPAASFSYALKKQTSLSFSYRGNTRQPSITEVQTLQQNIDPLNQTIGNPNLKQEFTNNLELSFNDYKALSGRYTWASLSFNNTADAISTQQQIRPNGSTTTFVNVDGNYSGSFYMGGGIRLKKPAIYIGGSLSSSLSHTLSYIDGQANVSNNNSYGVNPYLSYEKEDKYELSYSPGFTYNNNKSSISRYSSSYWMMDNDFSATVQLPKKFDIGSSINFYLRQKTEVFNQNNNVTRWNAHVGKKFLKNGQLETRISVFDILNQNKGYNRNAAGGVVTENTYNTIRRYGMLNVIWNFTHTPGAPATKTENE